ncbi:MAG: hypothetical protein ACRDS0_21635 [Pseudonocardiaceae bacterium]
MSVLDLTAQPYGAQDARPTSEQAGVPVLRQALIEGDDPELDTSLRTLDDLRAAVAEIKEFDRRTQHAEVVRGLPDVLRHLHRAVHDLPSCARPGAYEVLAAAYSYAVVALYRLGHLDWSHLADERARAAAAHGDDPLRAAVTEWNHSLILMFDGAYPAGLRSVERADSILNPVPAIPAVAAVRGALHLRAAIIAARATNSDLAADHLTAARSLAVSGQDEANFYGTKFGLLLRHQVRAAQREHSRSSRAGGARRWHHRRRAGCGCDASGEHCTVASRSLLDRPLPGLATTWGSTAGAGFAAAGAEDRSAAHPLPPTSPRDCAHPGHPGCPVNRKPPALRRLVRHPSLTRQGGIDP